MCKVFAYMRISTKEERGKQRFTRQEQAIARWCKENDTEIIERRIYKDDASGKSFDRTAWKELEEDIDMMLSLNVNHISTYSLILEEKTILYHQFQKGLFSLSNEDEERAMYDLIIGKLTSNDYLHYEISNFAKKTYESKHNVIYWSNEEYVGVGAGSSGYEDGYRYKNTTNLDKYYNGIDNNDKVFEENEFIDLNTKIWEEVMLGLRMIKGISLDSFYQKYKISIFDAFPKIEKLIKQGFLEILDEKLKITDNNLYISNAILTEIM